MRWLHLAGPLAVIATAASASTPAPLVLPPEFEIIDLAVERHRRMTVPVTIKGEGPFRFIIDTGAQATVLSHTLADRLGLTERRTATLVGLNSLRPVQTATVPEVTLGSRSFLIQVAALVDPYHIGADGVLGVDSLQHQRVLLDFREGRIHVAEAGEARRRNSYDIIVRARRKLGQLIIARARIDGVRTAVIIDTGAQSSIGNLALLGRLRRARDFGDSRMTDINGIESIGAVRLARTLQIDRARIANPAIVFTDSPSFRALGLQDEPALLLGMSELRLFNRIAIDFTTREVLFDLPSETR